MTWNFKSNGSCGSPKRSSELFKIIQEHALTPTLGLAVFHGIQFGWLTPGQAQLVARSCISGPNDARWRRCKMQIVYWVSHQFMLQAVEGPGTKVKINFGVSCPQCNKSGDWTRPIFTNLKIPQTYIANYAGAAQFVRISQKRFPQPKIMTSHSLKFSCHTLSMSAIPNFVASRWKRANLNIILHQFHNSPFQSMVYTLCLNGGLGGGI